MMPARLDASAATPAGVRRSGYDRSAPRGIVHLGAGAFHKAHQAVYTDDAMAASGGGWMITGVSLRSPDVAESLNPQDGLYTLLIRDASGVTARVVGSIAKVLVAPADPQAVLDALAAAETRIVSLTITEKGYGLDGRTGGLDRSHPAIAADLASPARPASAIGFIVEALRMRKQAGRGGLTVLCCDNLPGNGRIVRRLVGEFAAERDPELARFIADNVSFPSTMVDRITPASTAKTYADALSLTGYEDRAAVETEPFTQWIVEDDFVSGRPDWEAGGALFVRNVEPYEKMKLRMLNGAHSMLAYSGFLAGHKYVRDVMADADLALLVKRHMDNAALTLDPVPGVDLNYYGEELRARFANPAIAHETYQIAMDGTQKLPQRLIEPAIVALHGGFSLRPYQFAVAAWMRYAMGAGEDGQAYSLRDPREAEIVAAIAACGHDAPKIVDGLLGLPGLFPAELANEPTWRGGLSSVLGRILADGMRKTIEREAAECRA
jgi:fructuronate reductase